MNEREIASLFTLENRVAIVTGGSRGIGFEIARVYALAGAKIVISSRKEANLSQAAENLRMMGADVLPIAANVSVEKDRNFLIQRSLDWGGKIDILVNNAGSNPAFGPLHEISREAWDKTFETNLNAAFRLSQLSFHAWMSKHGGVIVNTASVAAFRSAPLFNTYNITKAALVHLTKTLADEWGIYGIRINALAPGIIKTKLSRSIWEGPKENEAASKLPLSRLGEVGDISGAALLLASDAGSYITGQYIIIDGGDLIRGKNH